VISELEGTTIRYVVNTDAEDDVEISPDSYFYFNLVESSGCKIQGTLVPYNLESDGFASSDTYADSFFTVTPVNDTDSQSMSNSFMLKEPSTMPNLAESGTYWAHLGDCIYETKFQMNTYGYSWMELSSEITPNNGNIIFAIQVVQRNDTCS